jgi:hypothetical protein
MEMNRSYTATNLSIVSMPPPALQSPRFPRNPAPPVLNRPDSSLRVVIAFDGSSFDVMKPATLDELRKLIASQSKAVMTDPPMWDLLVDGRILQKYDDISAFRDGTEVVVQVGY